MVKSLIKTVLIMTFLINIGFLQPSDAGFFTCKIDGEQFTADLATWEDRYFQTLPVGVINAAAGGINNLSMFVIWVSEHFQVKTYILGSTTDFATYLDMSLGMNYSSQSGTLTITSKTDNRLQGEFEITLSAGGLILNVTEGKFDLSNEPEIITPCPSEQIYGEHSEETELLRYIRDNVLSHIPEGRELIRLYYQWSPVIVKAMEEDEKFKEEVKEVFDGALELFGEVAE